MYPYSIRGGPGGIIPPGRRRHTFAFQRSTGRSRGHDVAHGIHVHARFEFRAVEHFQGRPGPGAGGRFLPAGQGAGSGRSRVGPRSKSWPRSPRACRSSPKEYRFAQLVPVQDHIRADDFGPGLVAAEFTYPAMSLARRGGQEKDGRRPGPGRSAPRGFHWGARVRFTEATASSMKRCLLGAQACPLS